MDGIIVKLLHNVGEESMKKILVIGGSYFVGRYFVLLSAKNPDLEIHVLNRGNQPLKGDNLTQYLCDRHDTAKVRSVLGNQEWDCVIDFCAYEQGDIKALLGAVEGVVRQYIYVSTSSVYHPVISGSKIENDPLLEHPGTDPGLMYAYKKLLLEKETEKFCSQHDIAWTIFRPTFIYGPFNYAPRESYYFNLIAAGSEIPVPCDASGRFQFVYVRDLADILISSIGKIDLSGQICNISAPEVLDYCSYMQVLEEVCGHSIVTRPVTVKQVYEQNIPLPFPLDSSDLLDSSKITGLMQFDFTSFAAGMQETYDIYMAARNYKKGG